MGAMSVSGAATSRIDLRRGIARLRRTRRGSAALYVAAVGCLAVTYYLAGKVGLELAYLDGAVAALWPPAGLGFAGLFLGGGGVWPGIVMGDLLLGVLDPLRHRARCNEGRDASPSRLSVLDVSIPHSAPSGLG